MNTKDLMNILYYELPMQPQESSIDYPLTQLGTSESH